MQVRNIESNNISNKGFYRTVYKTEARQAVVHKNNTSLFRSDVNWTKLMDFLIEKYKDVEKVQVFDYACSIGSEPYSILASLFSNYEDKVTQKFMPIIARDYDSYVIDLAKNNVININSEEIENANIFTKGKFSEYFKQLSQSSERYAPIKKLTDNVVFEVGDITYDYLSLPKENVILFVRNFWPYLSVQDQMALPRRLAYHFDKNATIILGSFDTRTQKDVDFIRNGFEKVDIGDIGPVYAK